MSDTWPNDATSRTHFEQLQNGDPVAQSDFIVAFLDPLVAFLRGAFPHADDHDRITAAEDALIKLVHDPTKYDASRGTLANYLRMAARGDLLNIQSVERRHHHQREFRDCVELADLGGNDPTNMAEDLPSLDDPVFAEIIASFTDVERRVLALMRDGERRTEAFATILGISEFSLDEQARAVKRVKDRIIKRLQRGREEA